MKSKKTKVSRSSKSGRFVTSRFAKKHPSTTQTETVNKKPKPKKKGGNNVSTVGSGPFDDN